jgi:hypothetical protein
VGAIVESTAGAAATGRTTDCKFVEKKMRLVRDRENLPVATVEITLASDAVR